MGAVRSRFPRVTPEEWDRARELYEERGSWILLLTAVPVAGIILTTAAGAFGVGLAQFILWVLIGKLVLVILIRPPIRGLTGLQPFGVGGDERSGDRRPAALALVLLVLVLLAARIPLVEELFGLMQLRQPVDYLAVGLAVLAWASAACFIWRLMALSGQTQPSRA